MRGYCPKCKEYRSDNGKDAWSIIWKNDLAICERCGSVVDLWVNKCEKSIQTTEDQTSGQK
jgi:Fe2+ or Zn2+ uptake regulation protein